jgi:hypothetical protein
MEIRWTDRAWTQYTNIKNDKNLEAVYKQLKKCIDLMADNLRHPGLHTHKYSAIANPIRPGEPVFEAYAQNRTPGARRVFWCYGPRKDEITILFMAKHPND